jgi:SAM-dependent methyltransferase
MEKEQYRIMRQLEDSFWWYVGMRRISAALLPGLPPGRDQIAILDAGCGTGATLDFLSERGRVFGVDIADDALDHCTTRGHRNLSKGSLQQLPFRDASFDLVTSFDVIYHRAISDDVAALREFHRVLVPSGQLLLRVPAYDWLRGAHDEAVHTRQRYTASGLTSKLEHAGFRVQRITYANCFLLPLAVVKRLLEGRGATLPADMNVPRPAVNRLLAGILGMEAKLLRHVSLPFGLSVIVRAAKEPSGTSL